MKALNPNKILINIFVSWLKTFKAFSRQNNLISIHNKTIIIIFWAIINHSCAPFSKLPNILIESKNIEGIYFNECKADTSLRGRTLWSLIDYKSEVKSDSLFVKIDINQDEMLCAYLIKQDCVLVEKVIKGKFEDDGCFYSRRQFYIIPILPILFVYDNYQKRIYLNDGNLIFEVTSNQGGAFIIMASGDKYNHIYRFNKKSLE